MVVPTFVENLDKPNAPFNESTGESAVFGKILARPFPLETIHLEDMLGLLRFNIHVAIVSRSLAGACSAGNGLWGHATHFPVNTPAELSGRFKDVTVDREDFSQTMQHKFDECLKIGGDLDESMRQYLGDVYQIDLNVGRVLKALDDLGLRENTIVVFSSDHGPAPVILEIWCHPKFGATHQTGTATKTNAPASNSAGGTHRSHVVGSVLETAARPRCPRLNSFSSWACA